MRSAGYETLVVAGYGPATAEMLADAIQDADWRDYQRWLAIPWRDRLMQACLWDVDQAITRLAQRAVCAQHPAPRCCIEAWMAGRPLTAEERVLARAANDARRAAEMAEYATVRGAAVSAAREMVR